MLSTPTIYRRSHIAQKRTQENTLEARKKVLIGLNKKKSNPAASRIIDVKWRCVQQRCKTKDMNGDEPEMDSNL